MRNLDDDDDSGEMLQELCDLINEIETGPDAGRKLEQVRGMLKVLADECEFPAELDADTFDRHLKRD